MTCWRLIAIAALLAMPAKAEPVAFEYLGVEVAGNLEIAAGKSLAGSGVAILVHGTAGHANMAVIAALQRNLKQHGVNTLAITLSLGLPRRSGMFDCALEHDHRHGDATDEIIAWVEWLQRRGASKITLVGHSRGGAQAALALVERPDAGVAALVAVAPLYQTTTEIAVRYQAAFGEPLQPILDRAMQAIQAGEGDTLLQVPGFLHCKNARVTAAAFQDYYQPDPQHDVIRLLADVTVPSLVLVAGDDELMPSLVGALVEARQNRSLPDKVHVETIEGAGHMLQDLFADEAADRIATFIAAR